MVTIAKNKIESQKTIEKIISNYIQNRDEYIELLKEYSYKLQTILETKIHSVIFRVKQPDSLRTKIHHKISIKANYKNINESNYNSIVTDLGGIRILLLNQTNWPYIDRAINSLSNIEVVEKIAYLPSDMFEDDIQGFRLAGFITPSEGKKQYSSIHYTLKINFNNKDYYIEIQVRSLAEEQYAEIEHEIRYKSNSNYNSMTSSTLRNLSRAAGVMNYLSFQAYNCIKDLEQTNTKQDYAAFEIQLHLKSISKEKGCPQLLKFLRNDLNVEAIGDTHVILSTSSPILLSQAKDPKILLFLSKYLNKHFGKIKEVDMVLRGVGIEE